MLNAGSNIYKKSEKLSTLDKKDQGRAKLVRKLPVCKLYYEVCIGEWELIL